MTNLLASFAYVYPDPVFPGTKKDDLHERFRLGDVHETVSS